MHIGDSNTIIYTYIDNVWLSYIHTLTLTIIYTYIDYHIYIHEHIYPCIYMHKMNHTCEWVTPLKCIYMHTYRWFKRSSTSTMPSTSGRLSYIHTWTYISMHSHAYICMHIGDSSGHQHQQCCRKAADDPRPLPSWGHFHYEKVL